MERIRSGLRVLHLSSATSWRGGEQQIVYLVEELALKSVKQWIVCPKGSVLSEVCRKGGMKHHTYRKIFSFNPLVAWKIKRLCKKLQITHLHTHDAHAHTAAVLAAGFFNNQAKVIVHRRVDFPVGQNLFSTWKYNHWCVAKIICVSRFIRDVVAPAVKNVPKLEVVYSGISLSAAHRADKETAGAQIRREFGIGKRELIIANIAALAPHKDYYTFVETAEILLNRGLPAKFLLIGGDGGEEQAIRQFILQKCLQHQLILTGFRSDVSQILPGIDLLLFTSKTEGLGTGLLEAFAAGVPVVAAAAGGIVEIVQNEETGLLARVGDSEELAGQVLRLLQEPALQQKIIKGAKRCVKDFSKEKMAGAILQIYWETGG